MKTLPCGHTESQAAWLGCTEAECRPRDRQLSEEYWASRGGMPAKLDPSLAEARRLRSTEPFREDEVAEEDKEREELYPNYRLREKHPSHEDNCE